MPNFYDHEGLQVIVHEGLQATPPPEEGLQADPMQSLDAPKLESSLNPEDETSTMPKHTMSMSWKQIVGFRRSKFFVPVVLLLIIISAGVGSGIGAAVAVGNAQASHSSTTPTTSTVVSTATATVTVTSATATSTSGTLTSTSGFLAPTNVVLALDCPNLDGSSYITTFRSRYTFSVACGNDYLGSSGVYVDILPIKSYSLNDCVDACAAYNSNLRRVACVGVTFDANAPGAWPSNFGNCWLKNSTANQFNSGRNTIATARLVSVA